MNIKKLAFTVAATFVLAGASANAASLSGPGAAVSGGISRAQNGLNMSGSVQGPGGSVAGGTNVGQSGVDWFGTVRGRIGYLTTPTQLIYSFGSAGPNGFNTNSGISFGQGNNGMISPQ